MLGWEFPIVPYEEADVLHPPRDGAYVKGMVRETGDSNAYHDVRMN